jgi:hypothetical protein
LHDQWAAQLAIQLFLGRDPGGSHEALQHGDAGQQDPLRPEHLLGTGQQLMKSGASADLLTDKLVNEGVILAPKGTQAQISFEPFDVLITGGLSLRIHHK